MRTSIIALVVLGACDASGGSAIDAGPALDDGALAPDAADEAGPGPTQICPFTPDANGFFTLTSTAADYVVRLPIGYDVDNPTPQRLLVAIHGCGDTAYNFATWGAVPWALRGSQDYLAISLGGREGACWTMATDGAFVDAAIEHVRSCFYVHQKQIVLAGYSSGGMLAYRSGMANADRYAGLLIENSGLSAGVGGNVGAALDAAAWKLHVAHTARIMDGSFAIAGVRADRDAMLARDFPLEYRELDGTHDGSSDDWAEYLIPLMASWSAP
jgi:pimeloyl-ACP methyl ester carboxylesterase